MLAGLELLYPLPDIAHERDNLPVDDGNSDARDLRGGLGNAHQLLIDFGQIERVDIGWAARVVDGHDHVALEAALTARDHVRPTAVVADIPEGEW